MSESKVIHTQHDNFIILPRYPNNPYFVEMIVVKNQMAIRISLSEDDIKTLISVLQEILEQIKR